LKKRKFKKSIYIFIIIGIVALLILIMFKRDNTNVEEIQAEISSIKTYYSFTGNIEPKNSQIVYADKLLQISDMKVKEGDKVKKDDVLFLTSDGSEVIATIDGEISEINVEENEPVIAGNERLKNKNYEKLCVINETETIFLPKKELYLLFKLLSYPNKIFTRQQLMDDIWGLDSEADERTVDVHIKRIREKLKLIKEFEIITVRGLGYKAEKR
jgi:DNA-binding winged helix-turn-helix (wHTH) protein